MISGQIGVQPSGIDAESMRDQGDQQKNNRFLVIRQLGRGPIDRRGPCVAHLTRSKGRYLEITGAGTMEGSINRGYGRRVGCGHILIIGKEELLVRMAQRNIKWLVQRVSRRAS